MISASTVVATALTVECHRAPARSWDSTKELKFSTRWLPGVSFVDNTSRLSFVAETAMKYSGKSEASATIDRKMY